MPAMAWVLGPVGPYAGYDLSTGPCRALEAKAWSTGPCRALEAKAWSTGLLGPGGPYWSTGPLALLALLGPGPTEPAGINY